MNWIFDHVVLVVRDLQASTQKYRAAGFHVVEGGRHVHSGVGNALIGLADGSYLELFSFVDLDRASPKHSNWPAFERGGGFGAFWFCTSNLAADTHAIRSAGFPLESPRGGSRQRPDGFEVKFQLAVPSNVDHPFMPALIEDVTPRSERVPPYRVNSNGVSRIAEIMVRVPDLGTARRFYETVGATVAVQDDGSFEARIGSVVLRFPRSGAGGDSATGIQSLVLAGADGSEILIGPNNLQG